MSLNSLDKNDIAKLHSEVNQYINQKIFIIMTTAIAKPIWLRTLLGIAWLLMGILLPASLQAASKTVTINVSPSQTIATYNKGDTVWIMVQTFTTDSHPLYCIQGGGGLPPLICVAESKAYISTSPGWAPNSVTWAATTTQEPPPPFSTQPYISPAGSFLAVIDTPSLPHTFILPPAASGGSIDAFIGAADGDESATITVNTASNCSAVVPTPIPSPSDCPVQRLTKQKKDEAQLAAIESAAVGTALTLSSLTGLICGPAAPECVGIIEISGWGLATANAILGYFAGQAPPDPNFTVIAQPMIPTITPIPAQTRITPAFATALNALNTNNVKMIAYTQAAITAANRAQGAANAGNASWESAQVQAEDKYINTLVSLIQSEPNLLANLQNAWLAGNYGTITLTPNDAYANEVAIAQNGLPASIVQVLTQAGVDSTTITLMKNLFISMDVNKVAGTFPEKLTDPSFVKAVQTFVKSPSPPPPSPPEVAPPA